MTRHWRRRIVVASPGDVQAERNSLQGVLDELNEGVAGLLGYELKLWRWETDAYPGFHAKGAQGQIDEIMQIEEADIVIGIFWERLGTPVADAQSGTEHELRKAIEAWRKQSRPHVMLYFNKQAVKNADAGQLLALQHFKGSFQSEGLRWDYPSKGEFPNVVRRHLSRLLQRLER